MSKYKMNRDTKIALAISALGLLLFLGVAFTAPFSTKLFSTLFPKQFSKAAYLQHDNFESGNYTANGWTAVIDKFNNTANNTLYSNRVNVENVAAQEGSFGLHTEIVPFTNLDGSTFYYDNAMLAKQISPVSEIFMRTKIKLLKNASNNNTQFLLTAASASDGAYIGSLAIKTNVTTPQDPSKVNQLYAYTPSIGAVALTKLDPAKTDGSKINATLNLDTWYCLEVHEVQSTTKGRVRAWLNGELLIDRQNIDTGTTPISWLRVGADGSKGPSDLYFDDFASNDTNQIGCGPIPAKFGPTRSNASPSGLLPPDTTSVTMSMNTNVPATCKYSQNIGTDYSAMTSTFSSTGGTTHSSQITGITPNNDYTYYVRCQDATGETNPDDYKISFRSGVLETTFSDFSLASTYESISVYASFAGDENGDNKASLEWRKVGETTWNQGMEMTPDRRVVVHRQPNPFINQWRSSILGLTPDSDYEVKVTFTDPNGISGENTKSGFIKTRSENYPSAGRSLYVATTGLDTNPGTQTAPFKTIQKAVDTAVAGDIILVKGGIYQEMVKISKSGTEGNYIWLKSEKNLTPAQMKDPSFAADKVTLDAGSNTTACGVGAGSVYSTVENGVTVSKIMRCSIAVSGDFVRVSGFEFINGNTGIKVDDVTYGVKDPPNADSTTDVIIENNWIHNQVWVYPESVGIRVGNSDIKYQNGVQRVTVQNNEIVPPPKDPNSGAIWFTTTSGGNVIRGNKITFDHWNTLRTDPIKPIEHGTDCIVGSGNNDWWGGYFKDTDIYNNYCENATDDAFSLDGGSMNLRVWNNTIVGANTAFSVAPVVVGPTYVFRNVTHYIAVHWTGCTAVKEGEEGTGTTYFYHNTFYVADPTNKCTYDNPLITTDTPRQTSVVVAKDGSGTASENLVFKNNIMHAFSKTLAIASVMPGLVMDYNIHFDDNGLTDSVITELAYTFTQFNNPANPNAFVQRTGFEKNGIYAKPIYVNAIAGDFRLAAGSPGIDKGVVIPGVNDSTTKWAYSGTAPDIGAFEVVGIASPTQTPSNPGDFNTNGTVEIDDYTTFVEGYGQSISTLDDKHKRADLNSNGQIDQDDYTRFVSVFGVKYF